MGQNGTIVSTANGGRTWRRQRASTDAYLGGVTFADALHGWAVGAAGASGVILGTSDGGETWRTQSLSAESVLAIACTGPRRAWAVGANGTVLAAIGAGAPAVASLQPASGRRGALVVIRGSGFGSRRGSGSVKFGSTTCTSYRSWSATRVSCAVPSASRLGTVRVIVATSAGTSNAVAYTVRR